MLLQKHIGINNILQRLKLLYHQKAVTVFFNDEGINLPAVVSGQWFALIGNCAYSCQLKYLHFEEY